MDAAGIANQYSTDVCIQKVARAVILDDFEAHTLSCFLSIGADRFSRGEQALRNASHARRRRKQVAYVVEERNIKNDREPRQSGPKVAL